MSSEITAGRYFSPPVEKRQERLRSPGVWVLVILALSKCGIGLIAFLLGLTHQGLFPKAILLVEMLTFAGVGMFLFLGEERDPRALFLGAAYTCGAAAFSNALIPGNTAIESLWHLHPDAFVPLFLWLFARDFPRTLWERRGRNLLNGFIGISAAAGGLLFVVNLVTALVVLLRPLAEPPALLQSLATQAGASPYWTILYLTAIPALPFMLFKSTLAGAAERHRVAVFAAGIAAGIAPLMVIVLMEGLIPRFHAFMSHPSIRYWSGFIVYPSLLSVPVTTAYAVQRHHVLDVRIIVRKALQYALARYTVIAATGVPVILLGIYVYGHRDETVAGMLSGERALVLMAFIGAGWITLKSRHDILVTLDRRFFREQYDAAQILTKVAQRIQEVTQYDELTLLLISEIDRAFHPESVYVMVADESVGQFRCMQNKMRSLDATAEFAHVLAREARPVTIAYDSSAQTASLPRDERDWLAEGAFRIVVPMISSESSLLGFIGLGEKRSELPYSEEDKVLLTAIGASAAPALEKRVLRGTALSEPISDGSSTEAGNVAFVCSRCKKIYPYGNLKCAACTGDLRDAQIPYVLLGKFRFEYLVGSGAMGVVYRALDLNLRRSVAIKTLPRMSPEFAMRLREEARSIASAVHPNLATIFGTETWRGQPMLILEYLPGGSLAERIQRTTLGYREAMLLGVQLADALAVLHARGMLHRDVKPSNIAYLDDKTPKLLDFGLAQMIGQRPPPPLTSQTGGDDATTIGFAESASADNVLMGTPQYMSPELITERKLTPSIDIWGLCLVLYESLTGVNPKSRPTLQETLNAIVNEPMPDIRHYLPDCPEALAFFFKDAFSIEVSRQSLSARSLSERLNSILNTFAVGLAITESKQ